MGEGERSHNLVPGELVILRCLAEAKKYRLINSSIRVESANHNKTGKPLSTNMISKYLKSLQKLGLIIRDIDSREYILVARGWRLLYLGDITSFLKDRFNRAVTQGIEKAGIIQYQMEMFFSADAEMTQLINNFLLSNESLRTRIALSTVTCLTDNIWRRHILTTLSANEREVIQAYADNFREVDWFLHGPSEKDWQMTRERIRIDVEKEIRTRHPGIKTLEDLFEIEAENQLEAIKKIRQNIPFDVGKLKDIFEALEVKDEIPDITARKLWSLLNYLEDPENAEIYGKYLEKLKACPKTIITSSSTGFKGYLEKYWELFPEKREKYMAEHPWLYDRITRTRGC